LNVTCCNLATFLTLPALFWTWFKQWYHGELERGKTFPFLSDHPMIDSDVRYQSNTRVIDTIPDRVKNRDSPSLTHHRSPLYRHCIFARNKPGISSVDSKPDPQPEPQPQCHSSAAYSKRSHVSHRHATCKQ